MAERYDHTEQLITTSTTTVFSGFKARQSSELHTKNTFGPAVLQWQKKSHHVQKYPSAPLLPHGCTGTPCADTRDPRSCDDCGRDTLLIRVFLPYSLYISYGKSRYTKAAHKIRNFGKYSLTCFFKWFVAFYLNICHGLKAKWHFLQLAFDN